MGVKTAGSKNLIAAQVARFNQPVAETSSLWRYGLILVIALYLVASLAQSLLVPVFEGPDEQRHYAYARYLVNEHALPPIQKPTNDDSSTYQVAQESGQPPLYYMLVALVTAPIPQADQVDGFVNANPYMSAYDAVGIANDNHNRYLHGPERYTPLQGLSLAVHTGRLVSVVLGIATLIAVFGAGRALSPGRPGVAVLAAALVASQPVFLYLSSTITNDAAVICFSALSTWMAMRIARDGPTPRLALLAGLFAGLTALSKFNGVWMAGIIGLAILGSLLFQQKQPGARSSLASLAITIVSWAVVVVWWFLRNYLTAGDPFGLAIHAIGDQSPLQLGKSALVNLNFRLNDLETSIWFSSGWAALIPAPTWFYTIYRVLFALGGLGALGMAGAGLRSFFTTRKIDTPALLQAICLSLCLFLALAGGTYWVLVYMWSIGRLLFPALAAAALLAGAGWAWWLSQLKRLRLPLAITWLGAAALAAVMLYGGASGVITGVVALNRNPEIGPITATMSRTELTFLDPQDNHTPVASVVGYYFPPQDLRPGSFIYGRICWQSHGYTSGNFPYSVQLVGPGEVRPATRSSYHGLGSYPLTAWRPGEVFCDPTSLSVTGEVDQPRAYKVLVSMFNFVANAPQSAAPLPVVDAGGKPVYPVITRLRVAPRLAGAPAVTPTTWFGDFAGLVNNSLVITQAELGSSSVLSVTLGWVARKSTPVDAKVFMHVLDPSGKVIAQSDHQPDDGWFPTNYWQGGDVIEDRFTIPLPAGVRYEDVRIGVGMYDGQTVQRLVAVDAVSGQRLRDDMLMLKE